MKKKVIFASVITSVFLAAFSNGNDKMVKQDSVNQKSSTPVSTIRYSICFL